jgi:hypothetical protein
MRLTYYTVAAVLLPAYLWCGSLVPSCQGFQDQLVRAAGLRQVLTGMCHIPSEPAFQKVAPIERLANCLDREVASMHVAQL